MIRETIKPASPSCLYILKTFFESSLSYKNWEIFIQKIPSFWLLEKKKSRKLATLDLGPTWQPPAGFGQRLPVLQKVICFQACLAY